MKKLIFSIVILCIVIFIYVELKETHFEKAMNYYNTGNLTSAIIEFDNIKPNNRKFDEAQILMQQLKKKISDDHKRSFNEKKIYESEKQQKDSIEFLNNSIGKIKTIVFMIDNFRIDNYQNNLKGINAIINTFIDYESIIIKIKKTSVDSIRIQAEIAEKKLIRKRAANWPELRKLFAEILAKEVWIHDMYIYTKSPKHSIIEFISLEYFQNKNIQKTQDDLLSLFLKLRFKKVIYKTTRYDEDYKSYTLDTKSDGELELT